MFTVVGASGYVGSRLLTRLAAEGASVRAVARRKDSVTVPGVDVVEADLTRPDSLPAALEGAEVVFHCAAITGDRKEPYRGAYDAVNRRGTENLVRAAEAAGCRRLVVMSGLGLRPAPAGTYMATRWGLEEAVRAGSCACGLAIAVWA